MPKFNEKEVKEINVIIADIQKAMDKIKSKSVLIGARDKTIIQSLLKRDSRAEAKMTGFKCPRNFSEAIVQHFIAKGLQRDKFSMNAQEYVYLLH
jgi:hypothetical protein